MKTIIYKTIVIILIISILLPINSYAALTQEEAGDFIATFAENLVNNNSEEFVYSSDDAHRKPAYEGKKTSGIALDGNGNPISNGNFYNKYGVDCVGFVSFVVHNSLGIGEKNYTVFVSPQSKAVNNFELIEPKPDKSNLKRGDIIGVNNRNKCTSCNDLFGKWKSSKLYNRRYSNI